MTTDAIPPETTDLVPVAEAVLPATISAPDRSEWDLLKEQAIEMSGSTLVPKKLQGKPADVMLVWLAGRELAIPPIMALSKIHVIEGSPTMSAELMRALIVRAGHEFTIVECSATRCEVEVERRGSGKPQRFEYTWEDAMRAGLPDSKLKARWENNQRKGSLPGTGVWYENPKSMLLARATSFAARAVFPDVLMGVSYVPEEMGADVDPMTGEVKVPDEELIAEGEVVAFRERIMALSETYRNQLRDIMLERGWILTRLPVRLREAFDLEIAGLEQWDTKKPEPETHGDDTPVEGTVIPDDPEFHDQNDEDDTPDADVVEDPGTGEGPANPSPGTTVDGASRPSDGAVAAPSPTGQIPEGPVGDDGEADGMSGGTAAKAHPARAAAPPPTTIRDPDAPVTRSQLARIGATCADTVTACDLDIKPDDFRHALVYAVTGGRIQSAKELTKGEASNVIEALKTIMGGTARLEITGDVECLATLEPVI